MSKYRTPMQQDSSEDNKGLSKINLNQTIKYRLPFEKDYKNPAMEYKLTRVSNEKIIITASEIKLPLIGQYASVQAEEQFDQNRNNQFPSRNTSRVLHQNPQSFNDSQDLQQNHEHKFRNQETQFSNKSNNVTSDEKSPAEMFKEARRHRKKLHQKNNKKKSRYVEDSGEADNSEITGRSNVSSLSSKESYKQSQKSEIKAKNYHSIKIQEDIHSSSIVLSKVSEQESERRSELRMKKQSYKLSQQNREQNQEQQQIWQEIREQIRKEIRKYKLQEIRQLQKNIVDDIEVDSGNNAPSQLLPKQNLHQKLQSLKTEPDHKKQSSLERELLKFKRIQHLSHQNKLKSQSNANNLSTNNLYDNFEPINNKNKSTFIEESSNNADHSNSDDSSALENQREKEKYKILHRIREVFDQNQIRDHSKNHGRKRSVKENKESELKKSKKAKPPLEFYLSIYEQIKTINPFFRKASDLGGCLLLRIGKLLVIEPMRYLYYEGDISEDIYVIISGKVVLNDKLQTIKKYCINGETLAEYQLFENEKKYTDRLTTSQKIELHRENAKTLTKCSLLKISKRKYYKMAKEMMTNSSNKQLFNLIDNLFKINYLNKIANIHQHLRVDKNKTVAKQKYPHIDQKNKKKSNTELLLKKSQKKLFFLQ